jgi:hypothetical protein
MSHCSNVTRAHAVECTAPSTCRILGAKAKLREATFDEAPVMAATGDDTAAGSEDDA